MSEDSQSTAKLNGEWGERRAMEILSKTFPDIEYVSDLIDFYTINKIPVEVKTCQDRIEAYPYGRQGRYCLDQAQHEVLTRDKGFYLFLVKSGSLLIKARLIEANNVIFKRQINWRVIHE